MARWKWVLCLPLLLAACDQPPKDVWQGYVEAEFTFVAPLNAGRIIALNVARGDQVKAGQTVFALENDAETAARNQAQAAAFLGEDFRSGLANPLRRAGDQRALALQAQIQIFLPPASAYSLKTPSSAVQRLACCSVPSGAKNS